ncbi:MAG: DUF362 domain-containing protein [Candidatus Margulisiibacteriota bacterium]
MAEVFFTKDLERLDRLIDKSELMKAIGKGDEVALKIHFGEPGNKAFVKPQYARIVADKVKIAKGRPFLTDSNVLYHGQRDYTVKHLMVAHNHGFTVEATGAPVIIADGIHSRDYVKVEIDKKHFKEVYIGSAGYYADSMIAITHFKGHEVTGFGGAIKNIGMGLGSRAGKQQMHADVKPEVNEKKCTNCNVCVDNCPVNAISPSKDAIHRVSINLDKCIGCAECIVMCRFDAIAIQWSEATDLIQEKIAEYALGAAKNKADKIAYINFLTDISPNCDCYPFNDKPIAPNIGILASFDAVAIDQASYDLVNKVEGRIDGPDKFRTLYPTVDSTIQLKHAEEIGLGSRGYELVSL